MSADPSLALLCPQPRHLTRTGGAVLVDTISIRRDTSMPAQGYRLTVDVDGARIDAADAVGEHYARLTLSQLPSPTPAVVIEDWPDLAVRAVMLDVSRDRVPTMASLKALIERLAGWKINQLQLYFEHTFAYAAHEDVWSTASPFTPDEVRELDTFCRDHHIELVANQNCLGHAERWLRLPRHQSMALSPDGFDMMGLRRGPTTLDPANPAAFEFVASLLAELVPCFTSNRVHIGMDEPWELTPERIDEYIAWMHKLCDLPVLRDREVLVWGDILAHHPALLKSLPDNVTVTEWGYEADHPFDARARALAAAGKPMWVCPGTSSWQTLLGRTTNMRANTISAATAAHDHGGTGMLMTDWGDWGHHQPAIISLPAYAFGAAMSWCAATNTDIDLAVATDPAAVALGDVYLATAAQRPNCSALVRHLYLPQARVRHITVDELDAARDRIEHGVDVLGDRVDHDANELRWACDTVRMALDDAQARLENDGTLASIPSDTREQLADQALDIGERHVSLWNQRSRPGGLAGSRRWFTRLRESYLAGGPVANWPFPEIDISSGESQ